MEVEPGKVYILDGKFYLCSAGQLVSKTILLSDEHYVVMCDLSSFKNKIYPAKIFFTHYSFMNELHYEIETFDKYTLTNLTLDVHVGEIKEVDVGKKEEKVEDKKVEISPFEFLDI